MKSVIPRRAFTMVEVLVALGVLTIAMALLLPALQAAREAARRAQCQNNLHQLAVALQAYHIDNNCYPVSITQLQRNGNRRVGGALSVHCRLLSYLAQTPVYHAINFDVQVSPLDFFAPEANTTAMLTTVAVFLCPSDGLADRSGPGVNYRINVGVGPARSPSARHPDSGTGLFLETGLTRDALVVDGLSHTVAFSERLRGSGARDTGVPERDFWQPPVFVRTADDLLQGCRAAARQGVLPSSVSGGSLWFWSGRHATAFTHTQVPNGRVPDCLIGIGDEHPIGMATARSWHYGRVNAAMADGSVRVVLETIHQAVWRRLGTRNGGELVD